MLLTAVPAKLQLLDRELLPLLLCKNHRRQRRIDGLRRPVHHVVRHAQPIGPATVVRTTTVVHRPPKHVRWHRIVDISSQFGPSHEHFGRLVQLTLDHGGNEVNEHESGDHVQLVAANPVGDPLIVQVYCREEPMVSNVDNHVVEILRGLAQTISDGLPGL